MGTETETVKKRAPTLYAIIAIKLLKGLLFVALAVTIYALSDNDLPSELNHVLHVLRFNPNENSGPTRASIGRNQRKERVLAAAGTLVYSLFLWLKQPGYPSD